MPCFVILEHTGSPNYKPGVHWDLLLEDSGALRAWELLAPLDSILEQEIQALPDHRLQYLDYEGPISGNRGSVKKWDSGQYELISEDSDKATYFLSGTRLSCQIQILSIDRSTRSLLRIVARD